MGMHPVEIESTFTVLTSVLLGDSGVGKTQIFRDFKKYTFSQGHFKTEGVDLCTINCENNMKIKVWDTTSGTDFLKGLGSAYLKDANYIFLTFDITNRDTFSNLDNYLSAIREKAKKSVKIILIGNKSDCSDSERKVSDAEAQKYAEDNSFLRYYATSAKNNTNIDVLIEDVVKKKCVSYSVKTQDSISALSAYKKTDFGFLEEYLNMSVEDIKNNKFREPVLKKIKSLQTHSNIETLKNYIANTLLILLIVATFPISIPYLLCFDNVYSKNKENHGDRFLFFTKAPKQAAEVALNLATHDIEQLSL